MRTALFTATMLASFLAIGQTLPVITSSPTNVTVYPGNTAIFTVAAIGATGYQWLFDGTNIPGASSAALQIASAQSTNCGYYLVLVQNATGWVPSQMAYLTLDYTYGGAQPAACGILPFSNTNDTYSDGAVDLYSTGYPTNGTVQIVAGPQLDQMQPIGPVDRYKPGSAIPSYTNGYYNASAQRDPVILPGQTVYYGVVANFTNGGFGYILPSTIIQLVAGTNGYLAPSVYGLRFPLEDTWPDDPMIDNVSPGQLRIPGETATFVINYEAWGNCSTMPAVQWRKDGVPVLNATNNSGYPCFTPMQTTFSVTNVQASAAGIYDAVIQGDKWLVSPKMTLSIQAYGQGLIQSPSIVGTNLVCNLVGAAGRNYQVQWSTNLLTWNNLLAVSNGTGTVTFTNGVPPRGSQFYRTVLLP